MDNMSRIVRERPRVSRLLIGCMCLSLISACSSAVSTTVPTAPPGVITGGASYPGPASTITPDATQSFITGLKATDLSGVELTQTAAPTDTPQPPTPTFPAGSAPCRASNLAVSDQTEGATGTIVMQVYIANIGHSVCYLQGPPNIQLVDHAGTPLDLVHSTACFRCSNVDVLGTALPSPAQTAAADGILKAKFGLGPGEALRTNMLWNNWCQPFPTSGVKVQLTLPDTTQTIEGPLDIHDGGRCDVPGSPSTMIVAGYSRSTPP